MKKPNEHTYKQNEPSEVFMKAKDFGKDVSFLANPSDHFLEVFKVQFDEFSMQFPQNMHRLKLKSTILKKCILATNCKFPEWFDKNNPCYDHRKSLLDYLLKCLIKRNAKWHVKNSYKSSKYLSRLRHLKE